MTGALTIRNAEAADVPRLTAIYNHYIGTTAITFDLVPFTVEQRMEWFSHYGPAGPHRVLVAEVAGEVVGSAWSSQFRTKAAYASTVETSIYCAPEATANGTGTALYTALFDVLAAEPGLHRAVAGVTLPNEASVRLHERFGFARLGVFSEVGYKFDRYWDVAWYERPLRP